MSSCLCLFKLFFYFISFKLSFVYAVIWKILTVPIVFGEDVQIKCIVSSGTCHINQTRQWTGGKGYKLLGLNGHSTDDSKYEMKIHTSDLSFDLTVKNFSADDAFREYTCLCGTDQFRGMLMLNKTEYIRKCYKTINVTFDVVEHRTHRIHALIF